MFTTFCCFADSCRCLFRVFGVFFCRCTCVFVALQTCNGYTCELYFLCEIICYFFLFLLLISCDHFFLHLWSWVDKQLRVCFAFFVCPPVCFLAFSLPKHIVPVMCTPCSPLLFPLILSDQHDHPCSLPVFFASIIHHKTWSALPFRDLFVLFFLPTRDHAPHCIHPYPSLPICTHF